MSLEFSQKPKNLQEILREKADNEGFIFLGDIPRNIFGGRQIKSIAAFLDGEEGLSPDINLGKDINFKGKSGNYSGMKVHIDNVEEFIERVKKYYGDK